MANPTTVTVTGDLRTDADSPAIGVVVTLTMPVWLTHADGTVIEPMKLVGATDGSGHLSIPLVPINDDAAWLPQGWTYKVSIEPEAGGARYVFEAHVSSAMASAGVVTLGQMIPVPGSDGSSYATLTQLAALQAQVNGLVVGAAGVSSVNTRTGAVTLTATDITDSTAVGRSVVKAADAAAARTAIGAGTGNSNLALGTTGTTAAAGNHTHPTLPLVLRTSDPLPGGTPAGTPVIRY